MKPTVAVALHQEGSEQALALALQGEMHVHTIVERSPMLLARQLSELPPDVVVLESGKGITRELVDMVRWTCPSTRIILYAPELADEDAAIVERGIYFYAVGANVETLADIVRAALRRTRRKQG